MASGTTDSSWSSGMCSGIGCVSLLLCGLWLGGCRRRVWSRDCRGLMRAVTSGRMDCAQAGDHQCASLCAQFAFSFLRTHFAGAAARRTMAMKFSCVDLSIFLFLFSVCFSFHFSDCACVTRCCSRWTVDTQTHGHSNGCASNGCSRHRDCRLSALQLAVRRSDRPTRRQACSARLGCASWPACPTDCGEHVVLCDWKAASTRRFEHQLDTAMSGTAVHGRASAVTRATAP